MAAVSAGPLEESGDSRVGRLGAVDDGANRHWIMAWLLRALAVEAA